MNAYVVLNDHDTFSPEEGLSNGGIRDLVNDSRVWRIVLTPDLITKISAEGGPT